MHKERNDDVASLDVSRPAAGQRSLRGLERQREREREREREKREEEELCLSVLTKENR